MTRTYHTCDDPCGLETIWKFNGGDPWWICEQCGVRVCGESFVLYPGVEDIDTRCILEPNHADDHQCDYWEIT